MNPLLTAKGGGRNYAFFSLMDCEWIGTAGVFGGISGGDWIPSRELCEKTSGISRAGERKFFFVKKTVVTETLLLSSVSHSAQSSVWLLLCSWKNGVTRVPSKKSPSISASMRTLEKNRKLDLLGHLNILWVPMQKPFSNNSSLNPIKLQKKTAFSGQLFSYLL